MEVFQYEGKTMPGTYTRTPLPVVDLGSCCEEGLEEPLGEQDAQRLAGVLKAVAHPARLRLLSIITSAGEACACDLVEPLGLSQPTVSHHLRLLVEAGLVQREQRGKWAWFTPRRQRLEDLRLLFS
jgi:ArsR family transcriptional regulator